MLYKNYTIKLKKIKPEGKNYIFWAASLRNMYDLEWMDCLPGRDTAKSALDLAKQAIDDRNP